jgi:hypothetical protein
LNPPSLFLVGTFYATMVVAGLIVEFAFQALGLVPSGPRHAKVVDAMVSWNYTTVLDIAFLVLAGVLVWRFFATGGGPMLRMMDEPMDQPTHDGHDTST